MDLAWMIKMALLLIVVIGMFGGLAALFMMDTRDDNKKFVRDDDMDEEGDFDESPKKNR